jgi:hypothetical protein
MNKSVKLAGILIISCFQPINSTFNLYGPSFLSPRSQSVNTAREWAGMGKLTNKYCQKDCYGLFWSAPSYVHSMRPNRLAEYFFGTDTLTFTGSQVAMRGDNDILADYFGLSPLFQGTVQLCPIMQAGLVDLGFYVGFDRFVDGLYFKVHAPIVRVHTTFELNEKISNTGLTLPYPALYMTDAALPAPLMNIRDALKRTSSFGDVTEPLKFGKFDSTPSVLKLSDIQAVLGWNFINRYRGSAGFNLRIAAPTGNRSTAEFLFEPMVGNGKHWEFGAGFNGRALLWERDDNQQWNWYIDVNAVHLFKARNTRSFDLHNKFGSRYTLLKEYDANGNYTRTTVPTINRTTLQCDVSVAVQFEATFMFGYNYDNITFDVGYNAWARTREQIFLRESIADSTYALKGIANVAVGGGGASIDTESKATLHGDAFADQLAVIDPSPPIFIKTADLNVCSAANPAVFTHKLFAHLGYAWEKEECHSVAPFFGIGGEIEFEGVRDDVARPNKNPLSQWGLWLKAGLIF